ncbi:MAG: sulfatase-like hydrolase/transferase [Gammaproteobacteria bacterium]|nr:sulfatase-like hydrolase/transferase [Gammaproteobacteria bacterium]
MDRVSKAGPLPSLLGWILPHSQPRPQERASLTSLQVPVPTPLAGVARGRRTERRRGCAGLTCCSSPPTVNATDALGRHGQPALKTPNLDRLAATGCDFTAAHTEVPSCIAARRILLTGMHQAACGLVGYQDGLDWDPPHTVPGLLSAAGYQTELVGKLTSGHTRRRYGFDHRVLADDLGERGENDYTAFLRAAGCHDRRVWMAHGAEANCWIARPWHLDERTAPHDLHRRPRHRLSRTP